MLEKVKAFANTYKFPLIILALGLVVVLYKRFSKNGK
jgi:hypothetical protein